MRRLILIALICVASNATAQDTDTNFDGSIIMPPPPNQLQVILNNQENSYGEPQITPDRAQFFVRKDQQGNSVDVPVEYIERLCGDFDGCKVRLGMHNWDNFGRVQSTETLLFYNTSNRVWQGSTGKLAGTDANGSTEHVLQVETCYFTDGRYIDKIDQKDPEPNFGLLSWTQFVADCFLTIVD